MKERNIQAIGWDFGLLFVLCFFLFYQYSLVGWQIIDEPLVWIGIVGICIVSFDLFRQISRKEKQEKKDNIIKNVEIIRQIVLLDEEERPIKTWDISGKVSLVIGKRNKEGDVDIDLSSCAYGALVEEYHAVLNYSSGSWFVEDVSLENGVRIKKVEDGQCYRIMNRPCKIAAGDIIYIASTKLLLS